MTEVPGRSAGIERLVFTTGTVWAQEGQTIETMLRREDGGFDIVYEYTNRPGKRLLLLEAGDAHAFEERLEELGVFGWASDVYEAPEPQGVRWSLLIEGDGFEELALQGATHAFPPGFPDFVLLMKEAFDLAALRGTRGAAAPEHRERKASELEGKAAYEWHEGAVQPDDYPFAHSK